MLAKSNYKKETNYKKDTLISISGIESPKLECAKLFLYMLLNKIYFDMDHKNQSACCSVLLKDYMDLTNRDIKNKSGIKSAIKQLANLKIKYKNNQGQIESEFIFSYIYFTKKLKDEIIYFSFNPYILSKISLKGRGHRAVCVNPEIFEDLGYRQHAQNKLKFVLNLAMATGVIDTYESKIKLDSIEKERYSSAIFKSPNSDYKYSKLIDDLYNEIKINIAR